MTGHPELGDWPLCEPPEPPMNCPACGEAFTDARPFSHALGSTPFCAECVELYGELKAAVYSADHDVRWPGCYALAALDLDAPRQRRAAALYVALGWCDAQDTAEDTLRTLLTDGAKPAPDRQVRHEWVTGRRPAALADFQWPEDVVPGAGFADDSGWQSCARCGAVQYHNPRW
jgi:hypothetical protein